MKLIPLYFETGDFITHEGGLLDANNPKARKLIQFINRFNDINDLRDSTVGEIREIARGYKLQPPSVDSPYHHDIGYHHFSFEKLVKGHFQKFIPGSDEVTNVVEGKLRELLGKNKRKRKIHGAYTLISLENTRMNLVFILTSGNRIVPLDNEKGEYAFATPQDTLEFRFVDNKLKKDINRQFAALFDEGISEHDEGSRKMSSEAAGNKFRMRSNNILNVLRDLLLK